jgi:hypothetical protein
MSAITRALYAFRPIWCAIYCLIFDRKPKYEPQRWNDPFQPGYSYGHQDKNNCYNYGCDKATDSWAQPGYASSGTWPTTMDCPTVTAGALSDGLTARPDGSQASEHCCHTVALVIAPGQGWHDFHWYRLDDSGMWSHKPGTSAVRNVDNSGNPISDPQTADRGPYTVFCGFFTVSRCKVKIDGPL